MQAVCMCHRDCPRGNADCSCRRLIALTHAEADLEALLDAAALAKARAAPRGAWRPRCLSAEVAGLAAFCAVPEDGAGGGGGLLTGRQRRDAHRSARGAVREG